VGLVPGQLDEQKEKYFRSFLRFWRRIEEVLLFLLFTAMEKWIGTKTVVEGFCEEKSAAGAVPRCKIANSVPD